ncbi:MAG TPA: 16S rRNA processing protein RimM [Rhodospirillaceae bacterium]|nr:16S rRNA processing protein RimM [Rhodospirillaceae bacterium]
MRGRLCVGVVIGAHGIKGAVRIKSFTDQAADVAAYGPVEDEAGQRRFLLHPQGAVAKGGTVTARIDGVDSRDQAEALKGTRLFVRREALPATAEDEFYYSDLVGLTAVAVDGQELGTVKGVFDFGGGDVIEISGPQGPTMFPFTRAVVPVVDLPAGRLVVDPPAEVIADDGAADGD